MEVPALPLRTVPLPPFRDLDCLIREVIQQSFRAVEHFLINGSLSKITQLSQWALEKVLPSLVNFRDCLPPEDITTFLVFIKATFGLATLYCSDHFAAKLLATLTTRLKIQLRPTISPIMTSRRSSPPSARISPSNLITARPSQSTSKNLFKRLTETDRLNKVWTDALEHDFLNCLRQNEYFMPMRDKLRERFPAIKETITVESLKNRYFKILRSALKRLRWLQGE